MGSECDGYGVSWGDEETILQLDNGDGCTSEMCAFKGWSTL